MESGSFSKNQDSVPGVVEVESSSLEREEKVWHERVLEVERSLREKVDFNTIGNILSDLYRRSFPEIKQEDVKKALANVYLPKIQVSYIAKKEGARFDDKDNAIESNFSHDKYAETNGESIRFFAYNFYVNGYLDFNRLLSSVIHECLHIASSKLFSIKNKGGLISGFAGNSDSDLKESSDYHFESLNEGMTELITDAVYGEYLARLGEVYSPEFQEVDEYSGISFGIAGNHKTYINERIFALGFMQVLSDESGLSEDEVFKSFVAEYFAGGGLSREELKSLFEDDAKVTEAFNIANLNMVTVYNKATIDYFLNEFNLRERRFIKSLFDRDVVGKYNSKVTKNL